LLLVLPVILLGCATGRPGWALTAVVIAGALFQRNARPITHWVAALLAVTGIVLGATVLPLAPVGALVLLIALSWFGREEGRMYSGRLELCGRRVALVFGAVALADGLAARGVLAVGPPEVWVDAARPLIVAGLLLFGVVRLLQERLAGLGSALIGVGALTIAVTGMAWAYLLVPAGGLVGMLVIVAGGEGRAHQRLEQRRAAHERRLPPDPLIPVLAADA